MIVAVCDSRSSKYNIICYNIYNAHGSAAHYLFYLHLAFMIRAFLILYPVIPDTAGTVAPTAFLHIRKMQLKLREAKKKLHTVTEKISDLTKKRDSLRQQVGQSK